MTDTMRDKIARDEFWAKVDKRGPDECWEWQGSRHPKGYGSTKKNKRTHRVAWELTNGPIPAGLLVCHKCDNPPCVNPAHLFLGTSADNVHDMMKKGRRRAVYHLGDDHPGAKITEADVIAILRARKRSVPLRILAERYGVSVSLISRIALGLAWAHVKDKCQTCGATDPEENAYCSDGFHAPGEPYWPEGESIPCITCGGNGITSTWSFGVKEPDECSNCGGSGRNWKYPSGTIARYYGGPLISGRPRTALSSKSEKHDG
jgi:hypothetical protein